MVSTTIYNRSEVTERLAILISYVEKQDWRNAKFSSDYLLHSLLKYYNTRCIPADHFYELFERLNYQITYCLPGNFKKRNVWDELNNIIKEIKTSTKDPLERIKEIMNDVRHLFYNIEKQNIDEIVNCFDELTQLKTEMEQIGGAVYNYYTYLLQAVGDCESTMLRVKQTTKTDALFNTLDAKFSHLFQMAHKVIAPPHVIPITKEEVYQAVKQGAKMEDIVQATAMSDEELRAMLSSAEAGHISEEK